MPAPMEVDHRLKGDSLLDVIVCFSFGDLICEVVVGGHIGVVMFAMVELHDLTGDSWLKGAIVIYHLSARPISLRGNAHMEGPEV